MSTQTTKVHGLRVVFMLPDHIEYVRDIIGVDYVGIGGDYDGTSR